MSPSHTRKSGRLYRYYVSQTVINHGAGSSSIARVPAGEIEAAVIEQVRHAARAGGDRRGMARGSSP
uniref:Zinc ribbon domain-containing protein n=1 Tax=Phenylobacterium glaciei TaxID=2803784 RepID=A0A974P4K0_9CAUL|nr:zinc ribbon domain-containing protein [Phenylobacterium glaciei]